MFNVITLFYCAYYSCTTELTDICDAHLVNKGVVIDGSNATIYAQPTGPDPDARLTDLECRCRPNELVFTPCKF